MSAGTLYIAVKGDTKELVTALKSAQSMSVKFGKDSKKNFEIVGVSLDKDGEAWKESIKSLHITWPQMSDLKFWNSPVVSLTQRAAF